nr:MAG TPA: hypothetical protein [Caudoviricetes sp.]
MFHTTNYIKVIYNYIFLNCKSSTLLSTKGRRVECILYLGDTGFQFVVQFV